MNLQSPTQDQLASFQAQTPSLQQFMASIQPTQPSAVQPQALASLRPNPTAAMSAILPQKAPSAVVQPPQLQSLPFLLSGPVTPYQSAQILTAAAQGHPSAVGVSMSATQPF